MNYEELREKERELAEELKKVREELIKTERIKAINLLEVAIKSLEDVDNILLNPDCCFEIYCEECETEFDTLVSLADVIQSLRDLREMKG